MRPISRILFQPPEPSYDLDDDDHFSIMECQDGTFLGLWRDQPARRKAGEATLIFFHGNGEDLGGWIDVYPAFVAMGLNVVAFDYRGYGVSTGTPTIGNTIRDTEEVLSKVTKDLLPDIPLILYGRSLGGGFALRAAAKGRNRDSIAGVIVDSTFTSPPAVLGYPAALTPRLNSVANIKSLSCPVLVMHGKDDDVIPFSHGKSLYKAAGGQKRCLWVAGADHNDNPVPCANVTAWMEKLEDFIWRICLRNSPV